MLRAGAFSLGAASCRDDEQRRPEAATGIDGPRQAIGAARRPGPCGRAGRCLTPEIQDWLAALESPVPADRTGAGDEGDPTALPPAAAPDAAPMPPTR
jgi:hypothetical protein